MDYSIDDDWMAIDMTLFVRSCIMGGEARERRKRKEAS